MIKYNFFIPGRFPGMNEIIKEARGNKYASARQKARFTMLTRTLVNLSFQLPIAHFGQMKKVWIDFRWVEKNTRRDPDNICAGKKFILDGLVLSGLLKNDGWSQIAGFTDTWEVGKEPGVYVEIKEV